MDEAASRNPARPPLLGDEALRKESARESIELSRERVLRELKATTHLRRQEQLGAALAFLDEQLRKLC